MIHTVSRLMGLGCAFWEYLRLLAGSSILGVALLVAVPPSMENTDSIQKFLCCLRRCMARNELCDELRMNSYH